MRRVQRGKLGLIRKRSKENAVVKLLREESVVGCHDKERYLASYTNANADLKISIYVCVHIKIIPSEFRISNLKNSRVIYVWSLAS